MSEHPGKHFANILIINLYKIYYLTKSDMGKGDIKTTRGKIAKGTYGNSRPHRPGVKPPATNNTVKADPKQSGGPKRTLKVN